MSADNQIDDGQTPALTSSQETKCSHLSQFNKTQLELCNKNYVDLVTELFFLQHGGNYVDYIQFKKRPSQQLKTYLDQNVIFGNSNVKQTFGGDISQSQAPAKLPAKDSKKSLVLKEVDSSKLAPTNYNQVILICLQYLVDHCCC